MIVEKLNKDIFDSILHNLNSAKEKEGDELKRMKQTHNNVVNTKNKVMNIGTSTHYSNTNNVLYNQLQKEFGTDDMFLDCFYKFKYNIGDYAHPHYDSYSDKTSILLLSDNFTGGELFINGENQNLNKRRMFVTFDSKRNHWVSKVLSGYREVLVMLFKSTKKLI